MVRRPSCNSGGKTANRMTKNERYLMFLHEAAVCAKKGNRQGIIDCLNAAEKCTKDEDELNHLRAWRMRIQQELEYRS